MTLLYLTSSLLHSASQ
uniref:Uncharacterized protein n=1 Tax=Anguilla anguilla TaxID=7936 RepID=A0A0E9XZI7_ANGAN